MASFQTLNTRALGCHVLSTLEGVAAEIIDSQRPAAFPSKTTQRRLSNIDNASANGLRAAMRSDCLALRIRPPSPTYHGITFHRAVQLRGIAGSDNKQHRLRAVGSGLFRETKPVSTALGPGASMSIKMRASLPPSSGSNGESRTSHPFARGWYPPMLPVGSCET